MSLSYNDLATAARSKAVAAATDIADAPLRVFSLAVTAGTDAASVTAHDGVTAAGDSVTVKAILETTAQINFGPQGVRFTTGLSVTESGTTPEIIVTYISEA